LEKIKKNEFKIAHIDFHHAKAQKNLTNGPIKYYAVNSIQGLKKK